MTHQSALPTARVLALRENAKRMLHSLTQWERQGVCQGEVGCDGGRERGLTMRIDEYDTGRREVARLGDLAVGRHIALPHPTRMLLHHLMTTDRHDVNRCQRTFCI